MPDTLGTSSQGFVTLAGDPDVPVTPGTPPENTGTAQAGRRAVDLPKGVGPARRDFHLVRDYCDWLTTWA